MPEPRVGCFSCSRLLSCRPPLCRPDGAEPLRHGQRRTLALPRGRSWFADHSAARIRRDESHVAAVIQSSRRTIRLSHRPAWCWGIGGPRFGLRQAYDGPGYPRSSPAARLDIGPHRRHDIGLMAAYAYAALYPQETERVCLWTPSFQAWGTGRACGSSGISGISIFTARRRWPWCGVESEPTWSTFGTTSPPIRRTRSRSAIAVSTRRPTLGQARLGGHGVVSRVRADGKELAELAKTRSPCRCWC